MSIDRCKQARQIIESHFAGMYNKVTGDEPEHDGIYTVTAQVATVSYANELCALVGAALRDAGFECIAGAPTEFSDGGERRAALSFRVEVGNIRGGIEIRLPGVG